MKRFSFPLLLLLAYFLAEEFLSPEISVIVIAALGLGEFAYTRIKEKTYDCLTLFMTLLFCLPGSISLISGYTLPTIAQSVVIELSILIMLAIPVCSKKSISSILPASYRKNMAINEEQEKAMKRMMGMLLVIITLHLVATILVHYFSTEATSTFVNGPLLYILIALFFLVLFVRQRIMIRRYQKEEWLPVVDEKGKVIGKAGRSTCHSGSKLLHPVVHLHIVNSKGDIFLQKRSMTKKLLPGKWDTAVGGHVGWNEKIEDALKRETFEEIGITDFEAQFIGNYIWESDTEKELVFTFLCTSHSPIYINNDEVDEGRFWTPQEIETGIREKTVSPNFVHEYNTIVSNIINKTNII